MDEFYIDTTNMYLLEGFLKFSTIILEFVYKLH